MAVQLCNMVVLADFSSLLLRDAGFGGHDLSKYTVPTSFVGIALSTKVVGMLMVLVLPTKVVRMQASNQIQESKWSNFHLVDCQINPGNRVPMDQKSLTNVGLKALIIPLFSLVSEV